MPEWPWIWSARAAWRASESGSLLDSSFPRPGWVEQDAEHIWLSVVQAVRSCIEGLPPGDIAAVALSTQRESALLWDRNTSTALSLLLGWQDQRTIALARQLLAAGHADLVRAGSGLPLDPMFSALKASWLWPITAMRTGTIVTIAWSSARSIRIFGIPARVLPQITTSDGPLA